MTGTGRGRMAALTLAMLAAVIVGLTPVLATHGGLHTFGRQFSSELSGASVVDGMGTAGQGDPDGSGHVLLDVNPDPVVESSLCWWIEVEGIATPTGAHLHAGAVGTNGPIVATLDPFFPDEAMCVKHDDPAVIQAIIDDPSAFYVDVHTVEFPDGALRGQLPILNCVLKVGSEKATGPADDVTLAVGVELWVIGDFLPDSEIVIDFRREGSLAATVTVIADADGEFGLVHDFSSGDEGTWLIEGRVDGTDCADSAEVTVTQGEGPVPPGEGGRGATTGSPAPDASTLPDTAVAAMDEGVARSAAMLVLATIGVLLMARGLARRR
jgi:hypothetical protein